MFLFIVLTKLSKTLCKEYHFLGLCQEFCLKFYANVRINEKYRYVFLNCPTVFGGISGDGMKLKNPAGAGFCTVFIFNYLRFYIFVYQNYANMFDRRYQNHRNPMLLTSMPRARLRIPPLTNRSKSDLYFLFRRNQHH